ncbi:MAG: hypothetical protein GIW95_02185 [Candidatus Eremiobacteraeota bacterium]|nr:hypothetical protein [Candidatus Eremiobacteraeota bacterium]
MHAFVRVTLLFAAAFVAFIIALFIVKIVVIAAVVAALALGGIFLANFVRAFARIRREPPRLQLTERVFDQG